MKKLIVALPRNNEIHCAKKLCEIINKFPGSVDICQKHFMIDGKSIIGIMSIALNEPMMLMIFDDETVDEIIAELNQYNVFTAIKE